jgi:hypothetical protein
LRGVIIRSLHHKGHLHPSTAFFTSDRDLMNLRDGLVALSHT